MFEIEKHEYVATLWLNRPERRNAMGPEFFSELPKKIAELDQDESVRAVVIAGRGPHFSSGLDLMSMAGELGPALIEGGLAGPRNQLWKKIVQMRSGFDAIAASNKPFVAALQGYVIGGGLDLASACDIRVASKTLKVSLRETKVAIVADMGSLQRLESIIGRGHLKELAFTGKDIDADRALRIGLVNDVFESDELALAKARDLAKEIASNPPLVVQGTKEVLRITEQHGEAAGMSYVAAWNAGHLASLDLREAFESFAAKRPPVYKGQ